MFTASSVHSRNGNNGVKHRLIDNSLTNQESKSHQSASVKPSFIKRFNPFSKSKSQAINCDGEGAKHESSSDKEFTSVKVLKQFWNDQIKTSKSIEHLNERTATIRYFSQSNDSLADLPKVQKSQTLDARLPLDEFNKFKDADFVRNKKNRLIGPRPDSFALNDSNFPQISATGGKIHWARREDIFVKKSPAIDDHEADMSVKSNKTSNGSSPAKKANNDSKRESISSAAGSLASSNASNTNSASRKFSFKTAQASSYRKIATTSSGTKVAQIAQRFNQMIQQDATILDEVKKRGGVVLHRSGGRVFKIKEEKVEAKREEDDAASLPSIGKNSTRKKSSLKKRPSIRILVENPRKDGNVLSKRQLYETNIVNKETIVLKPKVPLKSELVLEKSKKLSEMKKTDDDSPSKKNNFQKIYDKITFRPTFLYGKKAAVTPMKTVVEPEPRDDISISPTNDEDELEFAPIDLSLSACFDSNLSPLPREDLCGEDENAKADDITGESKPDPSAPDMKPNQSFLFRSQLGGKLESPADVFIHNMLAESWPEPDTSPEASDAASHENSYEIIAKCSEGSSVIEKPAEPEENIYQSLCEVKGDTESVKSYESFENYDEIEQKILDNRIDFSDLLLTPDDDYILPEKDYPPEPPPPRKNTIPRISSPILTSTTSNLVQANLPKLKLSNSCVSTTYEKIKYDQLPKKLPVGDENIYDTIKNADNSSLMATYDKLPPPKKVHPDVCESFGDENPYKNSKNDTMSIISNCYESISLKQNYSTINQILRHAISTSTLSSEHRINSIYGTMVGQSLTPPSDRSASDNSDEWIDLSDEENDAENVTDNRFIV